MVNASSESDFARITARLKGEGRRGAILQAAIVEFASEGEAGARTEAIARAAGVNKALLHYYFSSKDALYEAVLEEVFRGFAESNLANLGGSGTAGERVLRHFLMHFDRLANCRHLTGLLLHEMVRCRAGECTRVPRIVRAAFAPVRLRFIEVFQKGVAAGELRDVDPESAFVSLTGAFLFYFVSEPFRPEVSDWDPSDPARFQKQRKALLDFAATALFTDAAHGAAVARMALSQCPEPCVPWMSVKGRESPDPDDPKTSAPTVKASSKPR